MFLICIARQTAFGRRLGLGTCGLYSTLPIRPLSQRWRNGPMGSAVWPTKYLFSSSWYLFCWLYTRWLSGTMGSVVWPPTDMGREFDSCRLRNMFFSNVRAGDNKNGYCNVPLDTSSSSVWRGGGGGDHSFKVDEIPRTRKHILCWLHSTTH